MAGGFESLGLSEELIRAVEGDLNWLLPTVRAGWRSNRESRSFDPTLSLTNPPPPLSGRAR